MRVHSSALRMRSLPPLPSAVRVPSAVRSSVGAIIEPIRVPAGVLWKPCGCRSASPMTLLSWMPVPGTKTPEQLPFDRVMAASPPSPSSTLTWVVPRTACGTATCRSDMRVSASARRTTAAGEPSSGGPASSSSSAASTSAPPNDGGAFVTTSASR